MKKVLHILASNKLSGAENVVIDIISNVGEHYESYYCSPDGPIGKVLEDKQINFVPIDKMSPLAVKKVIKEIQPDIIHAHDYRASVVGALVKGNSKLISHLHNNYLWAKNYNIKTLLYASLINSFDRIVVVSEATLNEHILYKKMLPKTEVIKNCIDLNKIYDKQPIKKKRNIDVLFVGRLIELKDPITFINGIKKLIQNEIEVQAGMVGDGELLDLCVAEIQRLELEDYITLYGFQSNPYKYMADSKILLMPSKSEGFSLVAMEAMSLGVPVVCTGVGGLKELVNDGENGFICSDIDSMVKAIENLLVNETLWKQMSDNAVKTAMARSDMGQYIKQIELLYE